MKINDAEILITPKLIAEAFWNLDSVEQARFFEELYDLLVDRDWLDRAYEYSKCCLGPGCSGAG